MRTRQVGWMFHEPNGRGLHYHRLFVPSGKVPPNLAVDAINWDAPIADELANTDVDYADSITLKIGAGTVNCLEPTETPGPRAAHRKAEAPDAWVFKTDRSNEIAERYRETLEWIRTIEAIYWEEEAKWNRKQFQKEHEERYVQLTEKQKEQQLERNRLMREEEQRERLTDTARREAAEAAGKALAKAAFDKFMNADGPSSLRVISFAGGLLDGLFLEHYSPQPLFAYADDVPVGYRFFGFGVDDIPMYEPFPKDRLDGHIWWCNSNQMHGHWMRINNLEEVRKRYVQEFT